MKSAWVSLPDPFADVQLLECHQYEWGYLVRYRATSIELLYASGCISARIRDLWPVKGGPKVDEDGDSFDRRNKPLRDNPNRVEITRHVVNEGKALALPGVRAALLLEAGDRECHKGKPAGLEVNVCDLITATRGAAFIKRCKPVGRYQRVARWTTCEMVILVDWKAIQYAARTANG